MRRAVIVMLALALFPAPGRAAPGRGDDLPPWLRRLDRGAGGVAEPGELAAAHAHLAGVSHCADCHAALHATPDARCLSCHEDVGKRIAGHVGWHGGFTGHCAGCHTEHRGVDADLLGLDRKAFNHERAAWPLRGAHATVRCDDCHRRRGKDGKLHFQTLGVPHAACADCHRDPHGAEFVAGRGCDTCHDEDRFGVPGLVPAAFDHDRDTGFPLRGRHARVPCAGCHTRVVRTRERAEKAAPGSGVVRSCAGCHDDPHRAALGGDCARCHSPVGWKGPDAPFDHAKDTRFPLDATHRGLACSSCHADRRFEAKGRECRDCHAAEAELMAGRFAPGFSARPDPHASTTHCADCHAPGQAPGLLAAERRCLGCHPAEYASLLSTRTARLDALVLRAEADLRRHPKARGVAEPLALITRVGAHHPQLAEKVLLELLSRLGDGAARGAGTGPRAKGAR